jgi:hypothetical protein
VHRLGWAPVVDYARGLTVTVEHFRAAYPIPLGGNR